MDRKGARKNGTSVPNWHCSMIYIHFTGLSLVLQHTPWTSFWGLRIMCNMLHQTVSVKATVGVYVSIGFLARGNNFRMGGLGGPNITRFQTRGKGVSHICSSRKSQIRENLLCFAIFNRPIVVVRDVQMLLAVKSIEYITTYFLLLGNNLSAMDVPTCSCGCDFMSSFLFSSSMPCDHRFQTGTELRAIAVI